MSDTDSDSDTLPYIDKPKHQISGVWPLCKCPTEEQRPTHLAGPMQTIYWCKKCGLYLKLWDMDAYQYSDQFAIEKEYRKQQGGLLNARV